MMLANSRLNSAWGILCAITWMFIIPEMAHRIPQALLSLLLANIIYYPGDGTQNPPGTVEPVVS